MNGWFLTFIILHLASLGINLAKHGEKFETEYSFWMRLIASLISLGLVYMAVKTGF